MSQDARPGSPAKKLRVKVYRDGEPLHEIDVRKDDIIIGRDRTADIQLSSQAVSRRHARLTRTEGGWQVADMGAANGVYVAREGGEPERIVIKAVRPGDVIVIETFSIKFKEVDDDEVMSRAGVGQFDESSLVSKRTQFISMVDVLKATDRALLPPVSDEGAPPIIDEITSATDAKWWARLESTAGHQRVFAIARARATVGTGPACEIQLPTGPNEIVTLERAGPSISLARLGRWPFPRVVVDGESVKAALLRDGESFSIGDVEISVHLNGAPSKT
jgi:pSer/pThr/pTyr-binding forkhead associated (FHA) protein